MIDEKALYFCRKAGDTDVYSSASFGFYLQETPFMGDLAVKNIASNDWFDEDGTDTYFPEQIYVKSSDLSLTFAGVFRDGSDGTPAIKIAQQNYLNFCKQLMGVHATTPCSQMNIYIPWVHLARQEVYFNGVSKTGYTRSNVDVYVKCVIKLTCAAPMTPATVVIEDNIVTAIA